MAPTSGVDQKSIEELFRASLTRVDHVLLSEKTKDSPTAQTLFVVQGDPKDPAMLRAHMPTADAAQRPVQESFTQLESVNQRLGKL